MRLFQGHEASHFFFHQLQMLRITTDNFFFSCCFHNADYYRNVFSIKGVCGDSLDSGGGAQLWLECVYAN